MFRDRPNQEAQQKERRDLRPDFELEKVQAKQQETKFTSAQLLVTPSLRLKNTLKQNLDL